MAVLLAAMPLAADTAMGYVLDAETDQRLAGVEVAFLVGDTGGFTEMVRHTTDAEGTFSFSGPFLSVGTSYMLVAHYEGLEYPTQALELGDQDQVIIEVFDGTETDDQIRIDAHHLFLAVTAAGIDVAQLVHIDNIGSSTYIGHAFGDDRHVLQLQVPEGNQALQGHSGQVLQAEPTRLYTTTPLPPGRSQVTFTIQLQGEQFDGTYEHEVLYPTGRLELFLQPNDIELPAALFQDLGEISLHDQRYRHYRVQDLSPGRRVSIPLPYSRPLRWSLKWAMLAFVLAIVAAAMSLARPVRAPQDTALPETELQSLLGELAAIDDQLETVEGADATNLRQRRELLKERVARFYQRLDDKR